MEADVMLSPFDRVLGELYAIRKDIRTYLSEDEGCPQLLKVLDHAVELVEQAQVMEKAVRIPYDQWKQEQANAQQRP